MENIWVGAETFSDFGHYCLIINCKNYIYVIYIMTQGYQCLSHQFLPMLKVVCEVFSNINYTPGIPLFNHLHTFLVPMAVIHLKFQ